MTITLYVDILDKPLTVQVGDLLEVKALYASGMIVQVEPKVTVDTEPPALGVSVADALKLGDKVG